jgi:hypothetical protein
MEIWHFAIIGGISGLGAVLVMQTRAKKDAITVLPVLREKGPLSIPQLQDAMNMPGVMKRGKLVYALDALVKSGQVTVNEPPPGTPQLEKIDVRTYAAK